MVFLLYRHTDDGVFDHFPKISEDSPKLVRRSHERCWTFPKIAEDYRRLPKTFEEDPRMFRWYTNKFKYNLLYRHTDDGVSDHFPKISEDSSELVRRSHERCWTFSENFRRMPKITISSHVRISYRFYQFVTTWYTTDFYMIINTKIYKK